MRKAICLLFGVFVLLAGGVSCSEKHLRNSVLYVHPQWNNFNPPKGVCSYLYVVNKGESRQINTNAAYYSVSLDPGIYRLLGYNTDTEGIAVANLDDFFQAKVTVKPLTDSKPDAKLISAINNAFRFSVESIRITEKEDTHVSPQVFSLAKTLTLKFETLSGDKYKKIYGTLRGVYYSVYLSTGLLGDKDVEWGIPFEVTLLEDGSGNISLNILGIHNPNYGNDYQNILDLVVEDENGEHYSLQVDLDEVISDMLNDNGGDIPTEIPVQIPIVLQTIDNALTVEVKPWERGKGNGNIN
ncbi:DUF5119 domain-containing protein [Parabacteroides sp. OttesenSCG-928-G07]|nr:DUF5119 domain-containing protein [Parabacteroides sp. OttesenSCG-928-G21]MDL2277407.1 DUF5119 domain-containing protein [Parabacteroides sp. OttesenSCG-928-G07]